jgi:hypothetical protein
MFRYNIVGSFLFRVTDRLASQKGGPILFQSTESVAHVFLLPVLKCVEKRLTKIFHWFRSDIHAKQPGICQIFDGIDMRIAADGTWVTLWCEPIA